MSDVEHVAAIAVLAARLAAVEQEQAHGLAAVHRAIEQLGAALVALHPGARGTGRTEMGDVHARGDEIRLATSGQAAARPPLGPAHVLQQDGERIDTAGGPRIDASGGGLYIATEREPGLSVEAARADAIMASSLTRHGVHAVGGGVAAGLGTSPHPCGVFAEGGSGDGLYATSDATAVHGVSSAGYGASFAGGLAPLHLVPAPDAGAPTSGVYRRGALVLDAEATLWLCVGDGSPGLWRQVVVQ
jgi:hypothetical protein